MNSRPCWCTPRWVYRLSGVSNFGSAAPPALHVDLRVKAKLMIILRDDVQDLRGIMESKKRPVRILDVRPKTEFGICHLPSSTRTFIAPTLIRVSNTLAHQSTDVPLHNLVANPGDYVSPEIETYVVCRLGNDSQIAAEALRSARPDPTFVIKDLVGGLRAWSRDVDPGFPVY